MDPSVAEPRSKASDRPFVAGAVILLAINAFLSSLRAGPSGSGAGYFIGALFGSAVVFVAIGLLVYGIARALGKARTRAATARTAFWTMIVLLVANLGYLGAAGGSATQPSGNANITDAERQGLQFDTDTIRHVAFGFVLPHPGSGFSASPETQRQLDEGFSQQPDMVAWAFRDTVRRQGLVIQVAKMARLDENRFRNFAGGVREGIAKSQVLEDTVSWQPAAGEYRLALLHPAGLYITMRCLPGLRPGRSVIVCVQTTADQPNALESSRAGLRFIE